MKPLTKKQKLEKLRKLKAENPFYLDYIKTTEALNYEYYVTKLAIQGLIALREDLKAEKPFLLEIEIPTVNGKEIKKEKDKSKIVDILKKSIKTDLYANSISSGVSLIELFLESIIRKILIMHPGKLSVEVNGKDKTETEDRKVDIKDILHAKTLEEIYLTLINQKIFKLFYSSPKDYFKYLKETIQINLDQDLILTYIEIKATRDLVIHNKCKVNSLYIQKAGSKARVTDTKQNIPFGEDYHMKSFSAFKKIVRCTYEIVSREYLKIIDPKKLYVTNIKTITTT
jgi:hypothetical protein